MTLLIKNVHIVGGAREFPEPCDIFVNGGRISAIGNFPKKPADIVLDGQGAHMSPGFIDVNTDSDHYLTLLEYPSQEDFLKQGVTTIFGGMCGASLAPLIYGGLESLRKWGSTDRVNVNWHSMAEFLDIVDRRPLGVNFGTLVGHSTMRRAIAGETTRDLTKNELEVLRVTLTRALREGGFGLSTGLEYVHSHKTPYSELKLLADIVKRHNGVYATHLRNTKEGIQASIDETIKLTRETKIKTLVNHFVPIADFGEQYEKALATIDSLPPDIDLHFDAYPSLFMMSPIYTFLPQWAQTDGYEKMLSQLNDDWMAAKIQNDMPHMDEDNFIVAQAPGNEFLVGRSLREIKQTYGLSDGRAALLKLMTALDMRGAALYKNISEPLVARALASPRSFVASNAPSFGFAKDRRLKSERTTSTFTKFLSMVEEEKLMPLETAVRKITLEPARKFGLVGRGEIKEGNFADLTCFKGGEIRFTIVNGVLAMQDGEFKGTFCGRALRHSIPK
jgi:N-acyl-D-aspartate/D-glutamate deacylase